MAKKKMFPADKQPSSELHKNGMMQIDIYSTTPRVEIKLFGKIPDEVHRDLQLAVDAVLVHHGL